MGLVNRLYGIVLFVCADEFYVPPACGVKDGNYQAAVVPLDVEYHAIVFQEIVDVAFMGDFDGCKTKKPPSLVASA
ncbi:hypothetical protein TCT1_11180 [Xenorhabdus sp. TCT-1]|uniref:Uncharacterized protein n=1 Tax=Xenorhabdus taiwanensis TaxID=3085177 RepID=A0ABN7C0V0_9GAMM|nr:hypothetical protein TCT1_11180 [Xenorhabdus sp. TCT-1]